MKSGFARNLSQLDARDEILELAQHGMLATEAAPRGLETGEQALMHAVLLDAIFCLQGRATGVPLRDRQRVAAEAHYWIVSRDTTWPFSFESICHVLGLEPSSVRQRLLRESPVNNHAGGPGTPTVWYQGGMFSRLRTTRMRGNRRQRRLTPRRRRPRSVVQPAPPRRAPHTAEGGRQAIAAP